MVSGGSARLLVMIVGLGLAVELASPTGLHCGPGEYLEAGADGAPDRCVPCSPGSFQDRKIHRKDFCHVCDAFDYLDPRMILVDECTRFHNQVVECSDDGFYLKSGDCHACTDCRLLGKVQGQACTKVEDTICCDVEGMVVRDGKCEFEPIHCDPGQYLVVGEAGQRDECRPCGVGTNNKELRHRKTECVLIPVDVDSSQNVGSPGEVTTSQNVGSPGEVTSQTVLMMTLVMGFVLVYVIRKVVPRYLRSREE